MQKFSRLYYLGIVSVLTSLFLAGCTAHGYKQQGYIEGQFTYISSNFSGILEKLSVDRGIQVHAGDPLFVLEQQPESSALRQSEAVVAQTQAQKAQTEAVLMLAQLTLQRQKALFIKKAVSKESVDTAQSNFDQAYAQVAAASANLAAARANLSQAQWTKGQKTVVAPVSARVFDTYYLPGELVPAGQPILSLLAPKDIKVIFFAPESQLSQLTLGQSIEVSCDGCQSPITAKISFISPQAEYTPPVIYSVETRDKLVYRIEATPSVNEAIKLHPGQPVMIKINE